MSYGTIMQRLSTISCDLQSTKGQTKKSQDHIIKCVLVEIGELIQDIKADNELLF